MIAFREKGDKKYAVQFDKGKEREKMVTGTYR